VELGAAQVGGGQRSTPQPGAGQVGALQHGAAQLRSGVAVEAGQAGKPRATQQPVAAHQQAAPIQVEAGELGAGRLKPVHGEALAVEPFEGRLPVAVVARPGGFHDGAPARLPLLRPALGQAEEEREDGDQDGQPAKVLQDLEDGALLEPPGQPVQRALDDPGAGPAAESVVGEERLQFLLRQPQPAGFTEHDVAPLQGIADRADALEAFGHLLGRGWPRQGVPPLLPRCRWVEVCHRGSPGGTPHPIESAPLFR